MHYTSITDRLSNLGAEKWLVHSHARDMALKGDDVIELTIGEPDIATETALIDECVRSLYAGRTGYSDGRGESEMLGAIAAKYALRTGRNISKNNVLCFPGTQTALYATMMALAETGDEVLVGDPLYATYDGVIQASGAERASVALHQEHQFCMQAEDLEAAITPKSKVLLLNYPHNPTGAVLSQQQLNELVEVVTRHDLWIISDEVYENLIFEKAFVSPFDIDSIAERTVALSSISKSHAAPGFRSGWAVGPTEFCQRLLPLSETMLFGGQPFIADMTAYALTHPSLASKHMCDAYFHRAKLVASAIESVPRLIPLMPSAGMFILLDVRATGMTGDQFAWALLRDAKVAVMPGSSFSDYSDGFIRISLTVPEERLLEACNRIRAFASSIDQG